MCAFHGRPRNENARRGAISPNRAMIQNQTRLSGGFVGDPQRVEATIHAGQHKQADRVGIPIVLQAVIERRIQLDGSVTVIDGIELDAGALSGIGFGP